ncbi:MAG: UDP-N-acetylmuramoyl-tripeptide--D-alanyl-D-alanine ligase [Candidatus Uhrbacteria bacterium]
MRRLLQSLLATLARAVIRRQRPRIIGITGSVGKTSAREATAAVLRPHYRVRSATENHNNEIGLPLTIISERTPGRSAIGWFCVLARGLVLSFARSSRYPDVLVLEYAADHPGDLVYLLNIARPNIAVVTAVGPAHAEFFKSIERIAAEKQRLVAALPRDGIAVLNIDDDLVAAMSERTRARVVTYGFDEAAEVCAIEHQVRYDDAGFPVGIAFKAVVGGSVVPAALLGCLGRGHTSAALVAIAVGHALGLHLVELSRALRDYVPQPGRSRIIAGIKNTTLLDDSYNASPLAVAAALEMLAGLQVRGRRIAVLGDMLELGSLTEHEHRHMGELAAASGLALLVCVGEASRHLAAGARRAGMSADAIFEFHDALSAGRFIQDRIMSGDVILVKGSRRTRMERIVRELMAEPLHADELLCR